MEKLGSISVYILAGDISYNKGDRGNLMSQIALIKSRYPQADITLCSMNADVDRCWYEARVIQRSIFLNSLQRKYIKEADVVIWGGGAPVTDHGCMTLIPYWMSIIFVAKFIYKKPIMAWSHGVVLKTRLGKYLAKTLYNWIDIISVRDETSCQCIQQLSSDLRPHKTADVAVLMQYDSNPNKEVNDVLEWIADQKMTVGINPTYWHLYNRSKHILPYVFRKKLGIFTYPNPEQLRLYNNGLTMLIDELVSRYNCSILLLPRYADPKWDDVTHLENISSQAQNPHKIRILKDDAYSPSQYPLIIQNLDFSISIALHEAIFAAVTSTPFIHLFYESKGSDFMTELHAQDRMLPWTTLMQEGGILNIVSMVDYTISHWHEIKAKQDTNLNMLKKKAAENVDLLSTLV